MREVNDTESGRFSLMGQALKIIHGLRMAMGIWVFETRIATGSGYVISSLSDIDRAVHMEGKNHLHPKDMEQIITLLQRDSDES